MASYENFHNGNEPLSSNYGNFTGYRVNPSQISFPTDATSSNQLKKVSDKISTGAKNIEVSGLNLFAATPMKGLAAIPKQHWKEIDRLRKLTGVDLTFHGPLVEPTGVGRGGWSEDQRKEAERQMKDAIELAQQIDPKGNVVVTFHSSVSLPEVERWVKDKDGNEKKVQMAVVNERTGELGPIPIPSKDYFEGEKEVNMERWLKKTNEERWTEQLSNIGFENNRARREVLEARQAVNALSGKGFKDIQDPLKLYELSRNDPQQYKAVIETIDKQKEDVGSFIDRNFVNNLNDAGVFANQAYLRFKNLYNQAYQEAEEKDDKDTLSKLNKYKDEAKPIVNDYIKNPSKIADFQSKLTDGIRILESLKEIPQAYKPLKNWAIEKAATSFANTALHGFKKFGSNAPIISIENPPAGMSGLSRGKELRELAEKTREKFVEEAVKTGVSKSVAKKQAEKLIGVTWDTGHINSIRKWGYDEADVVKEAKQVAPFVKHVHAVDNLGFEDSELPPGMGNVPFEKILKLHPNFQKAKKVIETGEWFTRQGGLGLTKTPVVEAFEGFGASVYDYAGGPSWNQTASAYGSYFGGLGPINPQIHHSIYNAGFTNLPAYLGGEIAGQGNSSFSGAPLE